MKFLLVVTQPSIYQNSHLSDPNDRIRAGGYYFLVDSSPVSHQTPSGESAINGPIFNLSNILSNVMDSATKSEIGATFLDRQEAIPICVTLSNL